VTKVSPANTYWDAPGVDDVEFNPDESRRGKEDFFDIISSGGGVDSQARRPATWPVRAGS
jgi:hypothetical protein